MNFKFFYIDGRPGKAMTVVHDLTAIREAEAEKKALQEKLMNARKLESLGTLAGGVAHDLNNILSGIVSYPDLMLLDLAADSPLRPPLAAIRRSGEKAAALVQDLLTLARRSVGARRAVQLGRIVTDFIGSPEYRRIIENRSGLAVESRIDDSRYTVMGSQAHIFKTVMNLVANAVEAMPAGGSLAIATRDAAFDRPHTGYEIVPAGAYVVLEVADTGIGMAPGDVDKIFEPFYTRKIMGRSGSGLGMSVVWGTVKDHDGYIDIATEEGAGTTFTLYFPASPEKAAASAAPTYIDDYLGRGEAILIVDDAPEQRELAGRMMQRLGYDVHTADSGETALAMVRQRRFDLLILDMIMPPGMDGLETYRAILEIVPCQRAIIASGYAETANVREAKRLGAGGYVRKPYTLERIGMAVRSELDRPVDAKPPPSGRR